MTTLDEIELHDALLKSMNVDYAAKVATVKIEFFEDAKDRNRKVALLIFEEIELVSQISSLERLQENAFAGNVNYWVPAQNGGTTYIYLVDGCVSIKAEKVRVEYK
jgi:hypothetical protein